MRCASVIPHHHTPKMALWGVWFSAHLNLVNNTHFHAKCRALKSTGALLPEKRSRMAEKNRRILNPKKAGGGGRIRPPRHFLLYLSRLLFFCAETSWLFSCKPCARFKTMFKKIGPRVMTRRCVIERWVQRKTDQKLIFNGNYTQIVFFVFRIHFHYVLSYLFGLFGVRTCVSILWHTSLPKNATFAWKNSEKPWFWRFLVIFVFLTWRHLWCHCDVIQGMFVLFLVPMDSGGS